MKTNPKSWAPFQSDEVRKICAHMTKVEQNAASWRSSFYGLWVGITCAIPLGSLPLFAMVEKKWSFAVIAGILFVVHIACIPIWLKSQRRFLCSTAWALAHGFKPEELKLVTFWHDHTA